MGGLLPYALLAPRWRSPPMGLVFILGSLFHLFPQSQLLYTLDMSTNAVLFVLGATQSAYGKYFCLFAALMFWYNHHNSNKKSSVEINLRHVVLVQWIGLLAFYALYREKKCNKYFFVC
jgi:hypothetical protein